MNTLSRRLVILHGNDEAVIKQLSYLNHHVTGDWVVVSDDLRLASSMIQCHLNKHAKSLLGREFKHAIFDARIGFNLDTFAILTGTLIAESLLILILPENFEYWHDQDSLRWNELPEPIVVPNFIAHLRYVIAQQQLYSDVFYQLFLNDEDDDNYLFNQLYQDNLPKSNQLKWHNYQEQQSLLDKLIQLDTHIIMVTAKRGRGKSALAGQFAQYHRCWVSAPNKNSVTTLMQFAPVDTQFFAPDELIIQLKKSTTKPDWLIIDEAAMIPLAIVDSLIAGFQHVLLTSTIDGYEGTGQGLLLKLLNKYKQSDVAYFQLNAPIRWLANDPLEYFVDNLVVACSPKQAIDFIATKPGMFELKQHQLIEPSKKLALVFSLLKSAHYRTTLIDLRRLLDAQNLLLYCAEFSEQNIAGVLVAIEEGGLAPELVFEILKGYRRPKGNLVAQSLVAHGGEINAALLRSIRVNRIAVSELLRKQGVARSLLARLIDTAHTQQRDFISASFAYSDEMYQFWLQCGFYAVHVGTHKEASSGSHAVMVIYPISSAGFALCNKMQDKLSRNWYWLRQIIDIDLPIEVSAEQSLNSDDIAELNLFATTSYAYSASFAVLYRLVNQLKKDSILLLTQLPLLSASVDTQFNDKEVNTVLGLSGKNELIKLLRQEVYQFIRTQGLINE